MLSESVINQTAMQDPYLEIVSDEVDLDILLKLKHRFAPGLYLREITIPKEKLIIGHHHRQQHLNIFLKGKMILFLSDGTRKEVTAPMVFTGEPGRKVAYAIEESMWMNVYATDETDLKKLEIEYIDTDAPWPEGQKVLASVFNKNQIKGETP